MNVHDWALVFFTILAQMSVGAFLILGVLYAYATYKAGREEADRLSDRALLAIGPVLVLGMLASLLHLGNPLNAYLAITNLSSSWLSNEILFGILFAVFGGLFAIMQWRKVSTPAVRTVIAGIAAILGIALVYSMAQIYMLRTVPTWNNWTTIASFFTTTFLLGALAIGAAFVANYTYLQYQGEELDSQQPQTVLLRDSLRWIAAISIIMLGVQFVIIPLYIISMVTGPAEAIAGMRVLVEEHSAVFIARLILVFLGAGVFGAFLYQNAFSPGREKLLGGLAYIAFVLVFISEIMGRFLFYATFMRVGI